MARGYVSGLDLDQALLLPPTPRDWLPEGHLAWFIDDVVAALDTSAFHEARRVGGAGRAGYDPDGLLRVLLYAYCHGERSSRRIEQLCSVDVAFMVLARATVPDHPTIARFRCDHRDRFEDLFVQVLALCAKQGLAKLGVVALDGTKMTADASALANRTETALREEVRRIVDEADAVDAEEDQRYGSARGDELPQRWADPNGRVERIRRCLDDIEAERARNVEPLADRVDAAEARLAEAEAADAVKRARRAAHEAAGKPMAGRRPNDVAPAMVQARRRVAAAQQRLDAARAAPVRTQRGAPVKRNPTDPDSRSMISKNRPLQGYNAQAAVGEDGTILAADVTNDPADSTQFKPMMQALILMLQRAGLDAERIGVVLADAGYWSADNATTPGPDRLIVPRQPSGKPGVEHQRMASRLADADQAATYRRRSGIVEPAFGRIKGARRFDRFVQRGLDNVKAEWQLICLTENLLTIHRRGLAAT